MSADLLAEFGISSSATTTQGISQAESSDSFFDDDFDSFVSPEPADTISLGLNEGIARHETHHVGAQYALDAATLPPVTQDSEVLFDASTAAISNEDDDWGTFERAEPAPSGQLLDFGNEDQELAMPVQNTRHSVSTASACLDLLSPDDRPPLNKSIASQITPSQRHLQTFKKPTPNQKAPSQSQPKTNPPEDDFFGQWDSFEDGPATPNPLSQPTVVTGSKGLKNSKIPSTRTRNSSQSQSVVRPTNIPPPSILLQIFPSLLENFREQLNDTKRGSTSSTSGLTLNLSCILKTASRIIAGRSLRWKRDVRLSQSMKIGPAQSGKTSGMKLSSVSRGESIKEEQEAVGLIDIWRHHASVFNSFLQSSGERPIPVSMDKVRITTAGPEQGALKASHACALCGLKRDERLPKVDDDAQDSFGDWWAEHWGHTDCKWFWEENSNKLSHR
ncbi:hypothetical protein UA08_04224 [Talaromyces atroroseus]|uniref:Uncharacterized protein n=1 Tax=Talaromyces atroroseus TaxID=1441469 RepID=A0A1Q5Q951_TALAT|nr:hypothetical protein UA08_04224 [Talaromyces atroroseus]OKL60658.1 hypothetical protein UA08_04224 [Talaromyces atroroseus]